MTPDRFERMVERDYQFNRVCDSEGLWKQATLRLLRRQYDAFVRLVKRQETYGFEGLISPHDPLAALAAYKKERR